MLFRSVKLSFALNSGDVISSYTTGIEENFIEGHTDRYFRPTKNIKVTSGDMGYVECKSYGVVIVCAYYGYW